MIGIMAAILASLHMRTAVDLFGGPQGSPRTDKLIAASIQWAEKIMERIDSKWGKVDVWAAIAHRTEHCSETERTGFSNRGSELRADDSVWSKRWECHNSTQKSCFIDFNFGPCENSWKLKGLEPQSLLSEL